MTPVWRLIGDNCHLTAQPWKDLQKAGFHVDFEQFDAKVRAIAFLVRPHCAGIATKPEICDSKL